MPVANEYLINLDASANLQVGDILTLVSPGEKVLHPITHEVLGTLDYPAGFLQVTRIKSGYSYARLIYADITPQKGTVVKRFFKVPAYFSSNSPSGETSYQDLRDRLSNLVWLPKEKAREALLYFALDGDVLTVTGTSKELLFRYNLAKKATSPLAATEPSQRIASLEKLIFSGHPVGVSTEDLDADGNIEVAVATDNQILISHVQDNRFQSPATVPLPKDVTLLALDAFDSDNDGKAELYVTATANGKLSSFIVEEANGKYSPTVTELPWFFRVADLADGKVLLGQRGDGTDTRLFRLKKSGHELQPGSALPVPAGASLFSLVSWQAEDGQPLFAYLTEDDFLRVATSDGTLLWESRNYFGGSETLLQSSAQGGTPTYRRARLRLSPSNAILVPQNDGLRTLKKFRLFYENRLLAMNWNGEQLVESWRTPEKNNYLGDYAIADLDNDGNKELVMAIKTSPQTSYQPAQTSLSVTDLK